MLKVWVERRIYLEEQHITIQPNEGKDGVVLSITEGDLSHNSKVYLSYEEALELSKQINDFVKERYEGQ